MAVEALAVAEVAAEKMEQMAKPVPLVLRDRLALLDLQVHREAQSSSSKAKPVKMAKMRSLDHKAIRA